MNVTEMEAAIRVTLNEPTQTCISSAEVLNALNDGYKDIATKALCVESEATVPIETGMKVYQLNCIKAIYARVNNTVIKYSTSVSLSVSRMPTVSVSTAVV
jgi:hypothetical protein